jgi:hypothetical protein
MCMSDSAIYDQARKLTVNVREYTSSVLFLITLHQYSLYFLFLYDTQYIVRYKFERIYFITVP